MVSCSGLALKNVAIGSIQKRKQQMKKARWIIGLTLLISPAVMADISLSFVNSLTAYTYSDANGVFTMDFTVGGGVLSRWMLHRRIWTRISTRL